MLHLRQYHCIVTEKLLCFSVTFFVPWSDIMRNMFIFVASAIIND